MNVREVTDFVNSLVSDLPSIERFWRLGDLTALRQDRSGRFYRSNYERGILLYALTAKHRPQTVLEFGTGRGYGCLCMAWAMEDHGISGRIYTIDMVPQDEEFRWRLTGAVVPGSSVSHAASSGHRQRLRPGCDASRR